MSETQNQMVLNYLKTGKVLTPIEALDCLDVSDSQRESTNSKTRAGPFTVSAKPCL